ncbi:nitrogen fixation protein NifM [Brenneria sp. 4F2]|nr:nitrogen fixation protein NifM [Brenneria bubanii]
MTILCNPDVLTIWQRYSRLKLSLSLYHCQPWQLQAEQKMVFAGQLQRQWRLEAAIREQAEQRGIRADREGIMTAQYVLRTFFDDEQAWNDALRRAGIDEAARLQALTHEAILAATLEQVASLAPKVDPREIDAWYQQNTHRFKQPEKRLAHHLLLVIDEGQADCDRVTVSRRISALQRRLQIDPRRFSRLAGRFSECPTAMDGGRIGWVNRNVLYPTLDSRLFSLDANDISPVVESPMGLHVLWCEAICPASELPKADALAQIRQQWQEKRRRHHQRQWLAEILR